MSKNDGFSKTIAVTTILVLIIGAGIAWAVIQNEDVAPNDTDAMMDEKMEGNESDSMMENKSSDAMMDSEDKMQGDSMPTGDSMKDDKMGGSDAMMVNPGTYKDYSVSTVEAEQKAGNKVVLFFHAPWCPFCKAANEAFISRAGEIPSGVVVLKTDYDSNTELKQKYGVTYQHTFVQIDNDENQVSKWNGGDIDNLKKYIK